MRHVGYFKLVVFDVVVQGVQFEFVPALVDGRREVDTSCDKNLNTSKKLISWVVVEFLVIKSQPDLDIC